MDTFEGILTAQYVEDREDIEYRYHAREYNKDGSNGTWLAATISELIDCLADSDVPSYVSHVGIIRDADDEVLHMFYRNREGKFEFKDWR